MRLFVALNLPKKERGRIHLAARALRDQDLPVRWVDPEEYHLTLKFLGEVRGDRLDQISVILARVAAGGRHRLSRGIEVPLLTGRPLSWWHREGPLDAEALDVRVVLLELDRGELYRRIDRRTEEMFERGFLDEVRRLLEAGSRADDPGMTAAGYRVAASVVRGELALPEAVRRVQAATRGYARRQLTWFRNQLPTPSLRVDASLPLPAQVERVTAWWRRTGGGAGGVGSA